MNPADSKFVPQIQPKRQRKVASIKIESKIQLLRDFLQNGLTIREAAHKNQIKLSTAKYILKLYQIKGKIGKMYIPEVSKKEVSKLDQDANHQNPVKENEQYFQQLCLNLEDQLKHLKTVNNRIEQHLLIIQQQQYDQYRFQLQCPQTYFSQLNYRPQSYYTDTYSSQDMLRVQNQFHY